MNAEKNKVEKNKTAIRNFIEEVLNEGNIDATDNYFHDDVVELDPFPGQGPGIEGLKDVLVMLRTAFPDMHWTVEEQIGEQHKVLTRFTWTGTHQGEFLGIAATTNPVSVKGTVIDNFTQGKVKETRILMDMLGLMQQLGVFPPPAV